MHEGVRYPCYQCEHAATKANALKKHNESKKWYILALSVSMLQLKQVIRRVMLKVNMTDWVILALNVSKLQVQEGIWRFMLKKHRNVDIYNIYICTQFKYVAA